MPHSADHRVVTAGIIQAGQQIDAVLGLCVRGIGVGVMDIDAVAPLGLGAIALPTPASSTGRARYSSLAPVLVGPLHEAECAEAGMALAANHDVIMDRDA